MCLMYMYTGADTAESTHKHQMLISGLFSRRGKCLVPKFKCRRGDHILKKGKHSKSGKPVQGDGQKYSLPPIKKKTKQQKNNHQNALNSDSLSKNKGVHCHVLLPEDQSTGHHVSHPLVLSQSDVKTNIDPHTQRICIISYSGQKLQLFNKGIAPSKPA